jgi:Tfp pilus assembly protein PilE
MIDIAIMTVTLAIVMIVGLVVMPSYTHKKANSQKSDRERIVKHKHKRLTVYLKYNIPG